MRNVVVGFLILLQPWPLASEAVFQRFIVWNVGQGQWTTWIRDDVCTHFDMGGEKAPPLSLLRGLCGQRENRVLLSHWDWDHVSFVGRARGWFARLCLGPLPLGAAPSSRKRRLLEGIAPCGPSEGFREISTASYRGRDRDVFGRRQRIDSNSLSRVWVIDDRVLVTGDSPSSQERLWLLRIPRPAKIRVLVLGHHGSRTSTGEGLLSALTGLKQAVASARFEKYGHPHSETVRKTKRHRVPLLKTEDWGSLVYEL